MGDTMRGDEAERLRTHAESLGLTAQVERAAVVVCLGPDAVLTLRADTPAVRYLLAHVAEVAE